MSDHGDEWHSAACTICRNIRAVANGRPGDRLIVTLTGAHHFSFSDAALTNSQMVMKVLGVLGATGGLGSRAGLEYTARYAREFFDIHLRGAARDGFYRAPLMPAARFENR